MSDDKIRSYVTADRAQLIALWQRVFTEDPPHNEPGAMLDAKLKVDSLIFIAEVENEIVGACMAGYDGHRGWLYAVAVDPEVRRQGLGKRLVKHAMQNLQQLGCVKINLQIRPDNTAVADFYRNLGFSVEDRLSMGLLLES